MADHPLVQNCLAAFGFASVPNLRDDDQLAIIGGAGARPLSDERIDYLVCGLLVEYLSARLQGVDVEVQEFRATGEPIAPLLCSFLFQRQFGQLLHRQESSAETQRRHRIAEILKGLYVDADRVPPCRPEMVYITLLLRSIDWIYTLPKSFNTVVREVNEFTLATDDAPRWCDYLVGDLLGRQIPLWNIPGNQGEAARPPHDSAMTRLLVPCSLHDREEMYASAQAHARQAGSFDPKQVMRQALQAIGAGETESFLQEIVYAFCNGWSERKFGGYAVVLFDHDDYGVDDNPFASPEDRARCALLDAATGPEPPDEVLHALRHNLRLWLRHHQRKCPPVAQEQICQHTYHTLHSIHHAGPILLFTPSDQSSTG